MTCSGSGYIVCRCWGDTPYPFGTCPECGGDGPCPGCENCEPEQPYVCPGCHAFGGESCAAYCIDAAIEREREERDYDDSDPWEEA